jgi:hypothetical protein
MNTFSVSLYTCGCGYNTTNPGNAGKHRKVSCGHDISVSSVSMVLKESRDVDCDSIYVKKHNIDNKKEDIINQKNEVIRQMNEIIAEQNAKIKKMNDIIKNKDAEIKKMNDIIKNKDAEILIQHGNNNRLQKSVASLTDTSGDAEDGYIQQGSGIIYFIVDKDLPDRGKIGRTTNTDVKKLKTRYSTFGNPNILCHWSTDIQKDENTLKKLMRDAGCMESRKEMIFNIQLAKNVFYDFVETCYM